MGSRQPGCRGDSCPEAEPQYCTPDLRLTLFQTKISFSEPLVKRTTLLIFSVFLTSALALCQSTPQQTAKKLTIEGIFAEGGITGRAPETIKWSPIIRRSHSCSEMTRESMANCGTWM